MHRRRTIVVDIPILFVCMYVPVYVGMYVCMYLRMYACTYVTGPAVQRTAPSWNMQANEPSRAHSHLYVCDWGILTIGVAIPWMPSMRSCPFRCPLGTDVSTEQSDICICVTLPNQASGPSQASPKGTQHVGMSVSICNALG